MITTTIPSFKTKFAPSLSRDERFFELFKVAFGHSHANIKFDYPGPDGTGVCLIEPKELRERCEDVAHLALYSLRYACRLLDEETTIAKFNKSVEHES